MNSKLSCNRLRQPRASKRQLLLAALGAVLYLLAFVHTAAAAASAPDWMRAQVNAPLPAHDEKTDAVLLYSEESVTVISADKVKTQVREAYKILRPEGRHYGTVSVPFDARTKDHEAARLVHPCSRQRLRGKGEGCGGVVGGADVCVDVRCQGEEARDTGC